jgi:hypothetical protein
MLQQRQRIPIPELPAVTQNDIDCREAPRFECLVRPRLRVMIRPSFLPVTVTVNDISVKGVGLLCESHIEPGSAIALSWKYGSADRWRTIRARVVHLSPRRDGGWVAGCVFAEQLQPADMRAFLQNPLTAEPHEMAPDD